MSTSVRYIFLLFITFFAATTYGQNYPEKPVRVVLGYSTGGSGDIIARLVADELSKSLGQSFIVENRAGAAGTIAASYVAKATPDGYTLMSGSSTELAANYSIYAHLSYNPIRDFVPIIQYSIQPNVLVVQGDSPIKNVEDLIKQVKSKPEGFTFGSAGVGSTQHMSAVLFMKSTGTKMLHVPYKGGSAALTDLLGGRIDMNFSPLPEVRELIKSGRLRALAVTSSSRSSVLPNIPTMAQAGIKDYEFVGWHALVAPSGTPKAIINKLNAVIEKALKGELGVRLTETGLTVTGGTPQQAEERLRASVKKYGELVKTSGMSLQ